MAFIGNTPTTQAFTPAVDYFSGTGSATAFTLSRPVASVAQVQVTIDNVAQNPSSAYTVSSNTITFTSAPLSGTNNIYVYYTSPITQVIAPGQGTVTTTSFASSTGTGAGVFQTSPTITTPVISSLSSASATALTLQSAGTTAITVSTSQNVGIGTTSPSGKLDVRGASYFGTPNTFIIGDDGGTDGAFFNETAAVPMRFYTSGSERMRIDSSGVVMIGKTSNNNTSNGFQVQQNGAELSVNRSGDRCAIFGRNTNDGTIVVFFKDGNTVGSISVSGSNVAYNTSSDYRLKENIAPMTGALAKVAQLKPVTYKWKANGSDGEGFIAHELAEIKPDCVSGEKDAVDADGKPVYQGIDVSFLVATLTAAIQELKAINDTQAETINALTARIEALENR